MSWCRGNRDLKRGQTCMNCTTRRGPGWEWWWWLGGVGGVRKCWHVPVFSGTGEDVVPLRTNWPEDTAHAQASHPVRNSSPFSAHCLQLNHFNLFGSGYLGDCERLLSRLVKKLR